MKERVTNMKENFSFQSHSENTRIQGYKWVPTDKKPKLIVQLIHGMAEYAERYEPFAQFLTENHMALYAHDHLGHGRSVNSMDELGFFHERKAKEILIEDAHLVTKHVKHDYPEIPVVVLGHSMGSFVLRNYLKKYSTEIDGAIIMGTAGYKSELGVGLKLAQLLARLFPKKRNKQLDDLAFGSFSDYFPDHYSSFDWLSKNQENIKKYLQDDFTGFIFTNNGFHTLFDLMNDATQTDWAKTLHPDLSVLVISGEQDPVGDFGKGPRSVAKELSHAGIKDVTLHLYANLRHEILNEKENQMVMDDIYEWLYVRFLHDTHHEHHHHA